MTRFTTRWFYIFAALLLASTTSRAALMLGFDMVYCAINARLIVRGFFDERGNLEVEEVFKGEQPTHILAIVDGATMYQLLTASINAAAQPTNGIEVVAFLGNQTNDAWEPVLGFEGTTALEKTNVYLFDYGGEWPGRRPTVRRDEHFSRESFLAAVKEQSKLSNRLEAFMAMPRSAERARKLVTFMLEHGNGYYHWRATESMRPINSGENKEILKEIVDARELATKCFLIDLAGEIPLSRDAFDSIAPFIGTQNPRELRRAAMSAISRLNPPEAIKHILPFIHTTEPELDAALGSLGLRKEVSLYLRVTDALLSLSKEVREQETKRPHSTSGDQLQSLCQQLGNYAHPKLVTYYFSWLLDSKQPSPDFVRSALQAMLGVQWPRNELETWWKQHQRVYNLQRRRDQSLWFDAYDEADEISKHLLVGSWMFSSSANQLSLINAACETKTATTAKAIIIELWSAARLGNQAKKAMFENFFKVKFSEDTHYSQGKEYRDFFIYGTPAFPFPFGTCIDCRNVILVDGKQYFPYEFNLTLCLEPETGGVQLGGLGSLEGPFPLVSVATAALEIRQLDYYGDGKELWHLQWKLGPIKLRHNR